MLATSLAEPFDHPDWLFEIKWDGYRAIAEVTPKRVHLDSRNNLSLAERFPAITASLGWLLNRAADESVQGQVEAQCKTLVGARCKQAATREVSWDAWRACCITTPSLLRRKACGRAWMP